MSLRMELFPTDLDAAVAFYTRVLRFTLTQDRRPAEGYLALQRGTVRIGAVAQPADRGAAEGRRPPIGVEVVLEVDDVVAERDHVLGTGWPLEEDLVVRPWGLTDFRLLDPAGYYLRITSRSH